MATQKLRTPPASYVLMTIGTALVDLGAQLSLLGSHLQIEETKQRPARPRNRRKR